MPGKKLMLPGFFIIQFWFSPLNQHLLHSLNYLFSLIELFAQFLHLVIIRHQHNTPLRNLHGHAAAGVKSRFL
ncbi:hypothetical protein SAMN05216563_106344 [Phytobacter palmae]|nr:hypothetical protein SAMN05216563_106344 [Phytobacter palmae]